MRNSIFKTCLIGFLSVAAFSLKSYCQTKIVTVNETEAFYAPAVPRADPHGEAESPDSLVRQFPLPMVSQLQESLSAQTYLRYYLAGRLGQIARAYRQDTLKGRSLILSVFGSPFDSVQQWSVLYGDDYLLTRMAPKECSAPVCEFFLAERIRYYCHEQYYETAEKIWKDFQILFPNGKYLEASRKELAKLETAIAANNHNKRIVFHETEPEPSIASILAPYKGKIVYLDIWGTWCGPCREEMKQLPALKKRFQGKDVVYLYLDLDGPGARDKWMNYVRMESIAGEHYRLSDEQMEIIWQSLIPGKNIVRKYPSYFIFDRKGSAIVTGAHRPSDREALYAQLEASLRLK